MFICLQETRVISDNKNTITATSQLESLNAEMRRLATCPNKTMRINMGKELTVHWYHAYSSPNGPDIRTKE